MISVKLGGQADNAYAPLLVGDTGKPLVEQAVYIEDVFDGLLAHAELFPSPQNCEEIHFSLSGADGTDLLTADTPIAPSITEDDLARLQKGLAALKAGQTGALKTQRAAIATFRLPSYKRHPKFYRQCLDPTTGKHRLAILWGAGVRDETGRVIDDGPVLKASASALVALLPPIVESDAVPIIDSNEADEDLAAAAVPAALSPAPSAASWKCHCWTVATVFLFVLAILAGLFYWWANRQYGLLAAGQRGLDERLTALADQVDVLGKRLEGTATTLAASIEATNKKLDDTSRTLVARLDATDAKLDETAAALGARIDATDKRLDETVAVVNAIADRLTALEKQTVELTRVASDIAKAIGTLQDQLRKLDNDIGAVASRLSGLNGRVADVPRQIAGVQSDILKGKGATQAIEDDINRIFDAFREKLGKPGTPGAIDTLGGAVPERVTPGMYEKGKKELGDIREGRKGKPLPDPSESGKELSGAIEDRRVEFPPGALPAGVVPPKRESKVLDEGNWTVPAGVTSFKADGFYVDSKGEKEPFSYTYHGRKGTVAPPGPKPARVEYEPVNPSDRDKLDFHPDKPPTLKPNVDAGDGVDVRVRGFDEDNQIVDQKTIRMTPSNTFAFPLRMTWRKVRGDVPVADVHIGDKPPPPLSPVEKEGSNVYTVEIVDANGKVMSSTAAKPVLYKPATAPKK